MAMVDAVIFSLLNNVTQLLAREASLIRGVKDEITSFQGELRFINQFLQNSAGKRDRVKEVVSQIRDIALEAEDVIDTFVIKMARHKRRNKVQKFWYGWNHITMLRGMGTEILAIKNRIKEIYENKDKYNIENTEEVAAGGESEKILIQRWRRDVEEDEVVGFGKDVEAVMKKLKTENPRRDVVSIIGLGGLGKTTLAKKIYKSDLIRSWFDCCAWVEVSQDYNTRQLLMKIVESVTLMSMEELTEDKLTQKMTKVLADKRYLIVLDDVWDTNLWDGIKSAFPDNGKGSRVLITSRDKEVASHASRTPYILPFLNEEESWSLFSKKVFQGEDFPRELEELGRHIVRKCHGLPLAIVVVAGLLANREEPMWPKVAADLSWYLSQYPKCLGILALSYENLPPKLKPCFLYVGVFPEDYEIPVRQLVRLWVAEGFVDQENSKNMEEVAEEYLCQLIDRSLIQVASRRTDGGIKSCRIHDLVRELSISKGKEEKFLEFHKKTDSAFTTKPRTVSINSGSSDLRYDYFLRSDFSRVRSLLCIAEPWHLPALERDPFHFLYRACRFIRVLDLTLNRCHEFPYNAEKLIHLRYLRMRAGGFILLPSSISKLPNLQTVDVRGTFSGNLWEMQELRHVFLSERSTCFSALPKDNDYITMPNIRTLSKLPCWDEYAMNCLKTARFPNLMKLRLHSNDKDIAIFDCLRNLQRLQTLKIEGRFRFANLKSLPLSLTKITLKDTELDSYAFPMLGELPNLQVLKLLDYSLMGRRRCCIKEGSFPKLQVLHMVNLLLECWSMEGGGNCMSSLRYLLIDQCGNLRAIPDQLKHLSSLRHMKVRFCPCLDEDDLNMVWGNDPRCDVKNCRR